MKVLGIIIAVVLGVFGLMVLYGLMLPSLDERAARAKAAGLKSVELYPSDESDVRDGMASALKDPSSARYGAFHGYLDEEGLVIVCGTVNARNSFGGYAGEVAFYGLLMRGMFAPGVIDGATSSLAQRTCLDNEIAASNALRANTEALLKRVDEKLNDRGKDQSRDPSKGWDNTVVKP